MTRPKPIGADPARDGAYQVVASFRVRPHPGIGRDEVRDGVLDVLVNDLAETEGYVSNLDVAVRKIGQQGEASQFEGEGPPREQAVPAASAAPEPPRGR